MTTTRATESSANFWSKLVSKFSDGSEDAEKRKQQLVAAAVAMTAMVAYAVAVGFIRIDIINTRIEYNDQS